MYQQVSGIKQLSYLGIAQIQRPRKVGQWTRLFSRIAWKEGTSHKAFHIVKMED